MFPKLTDEFINGVDELQTEFNPWHNRNFIQSELATYGGLSEEVGELWRIVVKRQQDIRGYGDPVFSLSEIRKEVGDVFIKLMDVAKYEGFDLGEAIMDRWDEVKQRDWVKDKIGHGKAGDT